MKMITSIHKYRNVFLAEEVMGHCSLTKKSKVLHKIGREKTICPARSYIGDPPEIKRLPPLESLN